jgi:NAD(P)-dependent dehydrogenase (short-subunit alcohol dehydrogenase family)
MSELAGKVALVTGGGRGIGRDAALELSRRGAKVAVAARSLAEVEAVVSRIHQNGGAALAVKADLVEGEHAVSTMVDQVVAGLGPIDILVNNAAIAGPFGATWEVDPAEWARAVELNLVAPFRLARAVVPSMQKRGWGRIINVSSGAARNPIERSGAYSPTKAGLDLFSRQLGGELAGSGVVVISLYPGIVDTSMQTTIREQPPEKVGAATAERFHNYYASGQLQNAERPGRLIALLAGEAGADKNGQIVDIYEQAMQDLLAKN